jgi:hypothetical protein
MELSPPHLANSPVRLPGFSTLTFLYLRVQTGASNPCGDFSQHSATYPCRQKEATVSLSASNTGGIVKTCGSGSSSQGRRGLRQG